MSSEDREFWDEDDWREYAEQQEARANAAEQKAERTRHTALGAIRTATDDGTITDVAKAIEAAERQMFDTSLAMEQRQAAAKEAGHLKIQRLAEQSGMRTTHVGPPPPAQPSAAEVNAEITRLDGIANDFNLPMEERQRAAREARSFKVRRLQGGQDDV